MADWDSIHYGFNASDETVNFGSRILAGIDNLYETSTLALLKNSDDISNKDPNIRAIIKNGLVIFSINKTIRIFQSLLCNVMLLNVTLDDEIDIICSNDDYLLLCLRNGTVCLLELQNFSVICNRCIIESSDVNESVFIGAFIEDATYLSFILVSRYGVVYRLSIILDSMEESNQASCDMIYDLKYNVQNATFAHSLLFLSTAESIYTYNVKIGEITSDENTILKPIFSLGYGKLLGLDCDGYLTILCTETYQTYPVNINNTFEEILLLSDPNQFRILGITKDDNDNNMYLQLIDFSDLTVVFSIKLLQKICLVTPEHIHDEILYLSVIKCQESISELRLQAITETMPENRLKRLIKRHKFDEAERFAKLFNLNLNDLQKAKARSIADKLICETGDVDNLIHIMNVIDDNEFNIEICLDTHSCCISLLDVERVLKYGCMCAQSDLELVNNCQYLCDNISQLLFRFHTFLELSRCGREDNNIQGWNSFCTSDLIVELCNALNHHRIDEAIIIYNRLETVTVYELSEDIVNKILQQLSNIPLEKELPFLYTFMPLTLSYLPSSLDIFIRWMLEKVMQIEINELNKFPDNAIEFLENMIQMLKLNYSNGVHFEMPYRIDQSALNTLFDHLRALKVLQTLKHKYRILVPFQKFLQEPKALAQFLLHIPAVHIMEDDNFFMEFIQTFMLDDDRKPDEIFSELIKDIIQYEEELWIKVVPVILKCICTINLKLESILYILKAANLPWSEAIHQIANSALEYSHPLVQNITKEIEYEPKCVILNKESYKLNKQLFNSIQYVKFAIGRIIYVNLPSMVDDIFQICKDSEERHEANMALINHFIEKGKYETALEILDNNKTDEIIRCCKKLVTLAPIVINDDNLLFLQDKYYNIIAPIIKRLSQNTDCTFEKSCLQDQLQNLQTVYKVRKTFSMGITTHQLMCDRQTNEVLDYILKQICIDSKDTVDCFKMQTEVASYFRIAKHKVFLKYCQQTSNFNVILNACERIYEDYCDAESLCCGVGLILKYMGVSQLEFENAKEVAPDLFFANYETIDINLLVDGLKLAKKMIINAILVSNETDINSSVELANWIQTTYFLTQDFSRNFSADLRSEYGMDFFTVPSAMAFNALRDTLHLYKKLMSNHITNSTKYLVYFGWNYMSDTTEEQLLNELQLLFSTVKCLSAEGQALMAFKLMLVLQRGLMYHPSINPAWQETLNGIIKYCGHKVQHKSFSLKYINKDFVFNLLLCNPLQANSVFNDNLRTYKRDLDKFQTIALIYLRYLKLYDLKEGQILCSKIVHRVNWWKRIKNCGIPYDTFFITEPSDILKKLIKLCQLDLTSIEEFCVDFGINVRECYKDYLEHLLINWKADIDISESDKRIMLVKNNENELYTSCLGVILAIDDNEAVLEIINSLWKNVSHYHYEVFICILKIQSFLMPSVDHGQQKMLLLFLKSYVRISKPGAAEIEEWWSNNPESHAIDVLSEWRLPFTQTLFTGKIWTIIRPEVNLKTYKIWFDATSFLTKNLSKNAICCYVIKEVVSGGYFKSTGSDLWILDSRHEDLIQEINECVRHISNIEQATSAVYLLATSIPGGADQVNIISLCYEYALKYKEQCSHEKEGQRAVKKVQIKYYTIFVTHILYKNKLADKQYLEMVTTCTAEELIDALYMDERIYKKALLATPDCPDINKTVDEIASLYNLDIVERRHTLIKNWLFNDPINIGSGDTNVDEENLIRASYVCTSGDISEWRTWLLKQAEVGKTPTRNLNYKARALKCFCNISAARIVEKLTNNSYESFRNFIEKLSILSNLESLGFGLTIDTLDNTNKLDLLSHLAFRVGTVVGTKTMASICITYNITEVKYWNVIITEMLKLNVIEELKRSIYFLKNNLQYYNQAFYIEAWQKVIDKGFDFLHNSAEQDIMNLCVSNFRVIQSCPVLCSLNLENIAKKCIQIKKYEFVVLLLRHLPAAVQNTYALELLEKEKDIYRKANQLSCYGFWGISQECLFLSEISKGLL